VAQRVGRGIALLFHDRDTGRDWVVSSTPQPHFTPGKDPVPILQEAGWAPGPVWAGGKSRPHRYSIPDRPAHSQSLYRLSYPAHKIVQSKKLKTKNYHALFHDVILSGAVVASLQLLLVSTGWRKYEVRASCWIFIFRWGEMDLCDEDTQSKGQRPSFTQMDNLIDWLV